jgi:hypothetical protein
MNTKPTKKQIEDWELKAAQYADSQTGEYFYEYQLAKNEKFAELAATWGASQALIAAEERINNTVVTPGETHHDFRKAIAARVADMAKDTFRSSQT